VGAAVGLRAVAWSRQGFDGSRVAMVLSKMVVDIRILYGTFPKSTSLSPASHSSAPLPYVGLSISRSRSEVSARDKASSLLCLTNSCAVSPSHLLFLVTVKVSFADLHAFCVAIHLTVNKL
jgi:hypothetical protein